MRTIVRTAAAGSPVENARALLRAFDGMEEATKVPNKFRTSDKAFPPSPHRSLVCIQRKKMLLLELNVRSYMHN